MSNRGTDDAGPVFVLGQVVFNGLLGGRTNLGATFGGATDYAEYHGLGLLAQLGVGTGGGGLSFSGFRSRSDPHEPLVDRDDDYLRDRASISFARPLPGFARANLTAGFGFTIQGRRVSSIIELAKPLTHADVEGRKELALFAEFAVAL